MKIYTSHIDDFSESDFERICNTVPDKLIEKSSSKHTIYSHIHPVFDNKGGSLDNGKYI